MLRITDTLCKMQKDISKKKKPKLQENVAPDFHNTFIPVFYSYDQISTSVIAKGNNQLLNALLMHWSYVYFALSYCSVIFR